MTRTYAKLQTVHIIDFQCLEDVTFDLGDLSVFCGEGDVGKSAILRAIRAVFLNDAIDDDIRHGQKQMEVTLTFAEGVVLSWWKDRGKGGCYSLDSFDECGQPYQPQVFLKTGGKVPEAIQEYLGIGTIEVDATTILTPQLSDQHDQPFILWEPGSKRARIIGKATRLDMVISAQMQCKKELDKTKREMEDEATALTAAEEGLEALPDYEALGTRVEVVEGHLKVIQTNVELVDKAKHLARRIEAAQARATAMDVVPLREKLDAAAGELETAERVRQLSQKIPELTKDLENLEKRRVDHQEALTSFQMQLKKTCEEMGMCLVCGGLVSHEECEG